MAHAPTLPEVPSAADDAVLEEALAEVDLKLSAWLSAVSDAETRLRELPANPVDLQAGATPADSAPPAVSLSHAAPADAEPRAPQEPPAEPPPCAAEALVEHAVHEEPSDGPPEYAAGEDLPVHESEPDPDEILLESLDPAIRREIHVRQRCCNYRKNVRELLAELETERSRRVEESTTKQKPWWRKGT